MPSMSTSAGALIAHVMVGVAPEDYTPYLFLKKLESLELLTLHAELAASVQRELHGRADTGPDLDDHGRSGAHLWVCRTVVLDK